LTNAHQEDGWSHSSPQGMQCASAGGIVVMAPEPKLSPARSGTDMNKAMKPPARRVVPSPLTPIRPLKAAQLLIDELRRMIVLQGNPGDVLPPERVLVETFKVSRPTLREAIRVLESEGLLEVRRGVHGGAVIRGASIEDLARRFGLYLQMQGATGGEVFALRQMIEPAAAALAAQKGAATESRLSAVLDYEADVIARAASDDAISVVLVEFHDVLLDLSGNPALAAVGRLLDVIVTHHTHQSLAAIGGDSRSARIRALRKSHTAHQRISEAIISGDAHRAETLALEHLAAVQHVTMANFADLPIDILGSAMRQNGTTWSRLEPRTTLD
jgi:DNA-binding FadR family transcriptional regulator